ncbi:MAG: DNA polymerase III subunit gamma/tau [Planctomycetes bacterium]|nr:DNA polymerase III subunit gamma/tau [Planctomycetota bacterium]
MTYTVLARRYRSTSFDAVVGQEPIAQTLQNAIAQGRIAHAYLFTGTRGVGKTSMARIFARALNAPDTIPGCPKPPEAKGQKYDYPDKAVQQRMADAIMRGDDLNVIEIDGASNNSVDNARQLIANAGLSPTGNARFKVYIIDEVHMLSTAAFNALLKTMEEPPSHVKFILCTTESHKVPATIQSRCQRFDFRNIPTAKIAGHLKDVLKQEKLKADDEVVWQVARIAAGSMRDSLSLMDRLIATGEQPLTGEVLVKMLGLPPMEMVTHLVDALAAGDAGAALQRTAALLDQGIAQDQLLEVLIERLRQLMLIAACGAQSELVELSDEARAVAKEQAEKFDAAGLVHMIALCENVQRMSKSSSNPRAILDAAVVRLSLAEKMADVTALLAGKTPATAPPPSFAPVTAPGSPGGPRKK